MARGDSPLPSFVGAQCPAAAAQLPVMPDRRFPTVAADGSFVVRVNFQSSPGEPIENVREWLDTWIKDHWNGHAIGAPQPFAAYFSAAPQAELNSAGELILVLRGVSNEGEKRFWKDWFVRICRELLARFPGAGSVTRMESMETA
jgi:hypothetical protein